MNHVNSEWIVRNNVKVLSLHSGDTFFDEILVLMKKI